MTVAERVALERRIEQLEDALGAYMRIMDMTDFQVTGDLRYDFLEVYCQCLMALPGYSRDTPLEESA